ncbi:MAG TPA: L,D-transpeptidase [Anaerolineae bacterium]|nr:L,D-transpeptidase [Anaerolineae bacterium]
MLARKYLRIALGLWLWLLLAPPAFAADAYDPGPNLFSTLTNPDYICPEQITRRTPQLCPTYSRGARRTRLEYLRAQLPNPLPRLDVEEIKAPDDAITPYTFAYVRPLPAPTYRHPEEAAVELPPIREFLAGDNWVTVEGELEYNGERWYKINPDEYIKAEHLSIANPSRFSGVTLNEPPAYPFGWINREVTPAVEPGGQSHESSILRRYELITIFAEVLVGEQMWYMVGPDRWVEQSYTSRVDVDPRPEGVGPDEKWIEVNTYEQTLAAYEGDRMVFATLVSTGRSDTWTPDGLTRIWGKLRSTPMQNREVGPESEAWYYLEDVEWTQYFNAAYALHAAYWHNAFSFTRSHGCVNLAIQDAKWLFGWTTPYVPEGVKTAYSSEGAPGTWVWIHKTGPLPETE